MADDVEVLFEPPSSGSGAPLGRQSRVMVTAGSTILAASELAGLEILTGCSAGMCGTDPVQILAGGEGLSAAEDHEIGTLERMGLSDGFRLACSARILRGIVHVRTDAF